MHGVLGVKPTTEAATRSGVLSIINILTIITGSRLSLAADLLGMLLRVSITCA
jgi:hypothetical protein